MGRLFDAVSAICGICLRATYEGQAAIELEMLADSGEVGEYEWPFFPNPDETPLAIDPAPVIRAVARDVQAGVDVSTIAARFHNTVARMVAEVCNKLREQTGLNEVALSGGVWQNVLLLERTLNLLQKSGFTVYTHRLVPPNDGGLSLGQAAIANARLRQNK